MGAPGEPERALLIVGMISAAAPLMDEAAEMLAAEFGPVASAGGTWPFDHTDYYEAESGPGLLRRFVSFEEPVGQERLRGIKLRTMEMEAELARRRPGGYPRPVNLDPGLLRLGSLILASTKASDHRVYLGDGIHAEITLVYEKGKWRPLPWTFPDFRGGSYHGYLSELRGDLKALRGGGHG